MFERKYIYSITANVIFSYFTTKSSYPMVAFK